MNRAEQNRKIADSIASHGWHSLHVGSAKAAEMPFSYSIGFFASFGAPEVMVFGLNPEKAHAVLSACAALLRSGRPLPPGTEIDGVLSGGYKVVLRPVQAKFFDEYLGTAVHYYGSQPFQALVMFLPDRHHAFPWQPGYAGADAAEPLSLT